MWEIKDIKFLIFFLPANAKLSRMSIAFWETENVSDHKTMTAPQVIPAVHLFRGFLRQNANENKTVMKNGTNKRLPVLFKVSWG
jgi:hypothetical protein